MNQDEKKYEAAKSALNYIEPGQVVGIGSGSTVNSLISQLDKVKSKIDGAISSSEYTTKLLKEKNIRILNLSEVGRIPLYIDGADESNSNRQLIKGGGGALTREKIAAYASDIFICMIDDSKFVKSLGNFPLPIEVIKMSQSLVAREMVKLGGRPVLRENFVTDNGNIILDIHNLQISEPLKLNSSSKISTISGVFTACEIIFALTSSDSIVKGL